VLPFLDIPVLIETCNIKTKQVLKSARKKAKGETKREMDGLHPKGYAGTADHPGGCPGQNILEFKNSGR